jgi:hypothetical protein
VVFSWEMAEELAAAHMRQMGFTDARRTPAGADRGIDVVSEGAVAQVKFLTAPVGAPDVQRFRGAAHLRETALFYSSSGYTKAARDVADELGIGLFQFDDTNAVVALNYTAETVIASPAQPVAPDLTPEDAAEAALLAEADALRFQATAWRRACSRGQTRSWDSSFSDPGATDLLLTARLDLVQSADAARLALAARVELIEICRAALAVRHRVEERPRAREWERVVGDFPAYMESHPGDRFPEYPSPPLSDVSATLRTLRNQLAGVLASVLEATSRPEELRRVAVDEARGVLRQDPEAYRGYAPERVLP